MSKKCRSAKPLKVFLRGLLILLIQAVCCFAVALGISLTLYIGGVLYNLCLWGLMPVFGALSACIATIKGVNNYLAWIVPPSAVMLAWVIQWGYSITPGPIFVCALISLIGAATGEVIKRGK